MKTGVVQKNLRQPLSLRLFPDKTEAEAFRYRACLVEFCCPVGHRLILQLCLANGKFCLIDAHYNLADPTEEWKVTKAKGPDDFHLCTNQEVIRIYLAQILASSVIVWETFDVHLFASLLLRIDGVSPGAMPYPYGKFLAPPPDPEP